MVHGLRENLQQVILLLIQVFMVGLTIGMTRTVIPGLATTDFGLQEKQLFLLTTFVVAFGLVKAVINLFAGTLSNSFGRKKVLIAGWIFALPIPYIIFSSTSWTWIVFSTVLLGVNQGLCWSMTINSKLDLSNQNQRGLVNGINEFSGYAALALAGIATAYLSEMIGARESILYFGTTTVFLGLLSAVFFIKETLPWAQASVSNESPKNSFTMLGAFKEASWNNKQLLAVNQAGLIEKFIDAIVWVFLPVFLLSKGQSLIESSAIILIFGITWGASQLITGPLSDKIGRKPLIVYGLVLSASMLLVFPYTSSVTMWSIELFFMGIGMAMLYPTLGASISDLTSISDRPIMLGVYRFWRDFGYAVAAFSMGIMAQYTQSLEAPFLMSVFLLLMSAFYVQAKLPNNK
jgi:MFS family permease